jgi:hypothetical protein
MSGRVVLVPDVLLAAVGAAAASDGAAARQALRQWLEHDTDLLVAAPTWPTLMEALRSQGWSAARIAEALHAIDQLDLETVEVDRAALLLAVDAMERHGLAAPAAAAVVLAELEAAPLATLDRAVAGAAGQAILVTELDAAGGETRRVVDPEGGAKPRPSLAVPGKAGPSFADQSSLPDYRGLGTLLGAFRRAAAEAER